MTATAARPQALKHLASGVPAELREAAHWLGWRYECRDEKWTKPPFNVQTGGYGDSTDPATWSTYEVALGALRGYDGVGWALEGSDVAGIDLDGCRDPESGAIDAWALEIVGRMQTYTEVSPSGTGLRIFLRGALPGRGHNKKLHERDRARYPREKAGIEVYDSGRYLTVTGHHLDGTPCDIRARQDAFDQLVTEFWPPKMPKSGRAGGAAQSVRLDDQDLLEAMLRSRSGGSISALWNGDLSSHNNDHSSADLALMNHLAFWTNGDGDRMERMFSRSVLGQRDKWTERADYRNLTIDKALEDWNGEGYIAPAVRFTVSVASGVNENGEVSAGLDTGTEWPEPLAEQAFHGWAGALVRAIVPYSEADAAALLAHVLCGAGALIGSHVFARAGDALHPARFNAAVVGETSKGRKGSAARPTERVLRLADPSFGDRLTEGLSSGEGLIWQVRDPIEKYERVGRGADRKVELVETDPGVSDKRLLVIESEFASSLRVIQREGNTLSTVVRRAWDSGDLKTLTKNSPAVATGAHICIIGHVTKDELLRYLDRSEMGNGFANRFLWFAAKRGQILPDGEGTPEDILRPFADELFDVARWAGSTRALTRDADAADIWRTVYPELSAGAAGMFGGATNRAEAQVLRLSVLYAALDRSDVIQAPHVMAGLAVWRYVQQSARWIFGDATGDPTADAILSGLRQAGEMSRNDLVDFFGRHVNRNRIEAALGLLLRLGSVGTRKEDTGGRPREVWFAR